MIGCPIAAPVVVQYHTTYLASGMGDDLECLSNVPTDPCRLSLSEQPVDSSLSPSFSHCLSFFSSSLLESRDRLSSPQTTFYHFKPITPLLLFLAILCIASPLTLDHFAFSPYSAVLSFRLYTLVDLPIQLLSIPSTPLQLLVRPAYIQMPQ